MTKIWGFGTAAVDIRIKTAEYGQGYTEKLLAQENKWFGGGATSNFLVQAVRLGGEAGWLGKLGTDTIGAKILRQLQSEGVDCAHVVIDENAMSPFNLAVYAGEEKRRIGGFLLPNCMQEISEQDLAALSKAVQPGDWVLIEVGEIPVSLCARMAELIKQRGAYAVVDVDLDPIKQCGAGMADIAALFSACDYLMPNIQAMRTLFPKESAEEIAKALYGEYKRTVILSMGDAGSAYMDHRELFTVIPGVIVDVVDTVGAGDAFHGGVVFGLSKSAPIEHAMRLGNLCGAHNCKTFGARDGMLRSEDLAGYSFAEIGRANKS